MTCAGKKDFFIQHQIQNLHCHAIDLNHAQKMDIQISVATTNLSCEIKVPWSRRPLNIMEVGCIHLHRYIWNKHRLQSCLENHGHHRVIHLSNGVWT